jgi:hypothetical protein
MIERCPMKRNPLTKFLALGALVIGTMLVVPTQQDAEAHWRYRRHWGPAYYGGYTSYYAPSYGGYYYAAPSYYYTAPSYYYTPSYVYPSSYYYGGYGGYPAYGGYYGSYASPGLGYYRTGYRGGWGFSIGF